MASSAVIFLSLLFCKLLLSVII